MAFKTKKMIVKDTEDKDALPAYESVEDVQGIEKFLASPKAYTDHLDFIKNNLDNPRLCAQVIDTEQAVKVASVENNKDGSQIIALHGFKVGQKVGTGKDGKSFACTKYLEPPENKIPIYYLVKRLSAYGQQYNETTRNFFSNISNRKDAGAKIHQAIDTFAIKGDLHYRRLPKNELYTHIEDTQFFNKHLSDIADLNQWLLSNIGCCFWDLGFTNGKNYMLNSDGKMKWVDYGGAGLVYVDTPPKGMDWTQLVTQNKQNLGVANSRFIMLQFILHMEYWWCTHNGKDTNAELYSSIAQVNASVLRELQNYILPNILSYPLAKEIFTQFGTKDWTDHITWKKIRNALK